MNEECRHKILIGCDIFAQCSILMLVMIMMLMSFHVYDDFLDYGAVEVDLPDWNEIQRSSKIGPLLSTMRAEQQQQHPTNQESYSVEHLKRLYQFVPKRPYSKPRANKLCSKVHPKPCPYHCKSCHFCRQRTTEIKTVCSVCEGNDNYFGGRGRGYWCGSCLWLRIGENIDEVRKRTDWVCPACRDICNCSGANCMRIKRGWFPTQQLSHEAREQGYTSVAHYLVLTHLSSQASAAPLRAPHGVRGTITDGGQYNAPLGIESDTKRRRTKRQHTLSFESQRTRRWVNYIILHSFQCQLIICLLNVQESA